MGSLSEADQATGAVSPTLPALHPWHQTARPRANEEVLNKASLPSVESILLQVQLRWVCHVSRMEDICMPKAVFFGELLEGKCNRGARRKRYKDQLKRQLAQAGINHQSWQQEASDRDSWCSSVRKASCKFRAERHKAAKEKRRRHKERAASLLFSTQSFVCPKCSRVCASKSVSTATNERARIDHLPSPPILICKE